MSPNRQNVGKDLVPGDFRLTEGLRTFKWPSITVFDSDTRGPPRATGGFFQTLCRACLAVCLWLCVGSSVCVCVCVCVCVRYTQVGEKD